MTPLKFFLLVPAPILLAIGIWWMWVRFHRITVALPPKPWLKVVDGILWIIAAVITGILLFWLMFAAVVFSL